MKAALFLLGSALVLGVESQQCDTPVDEWPPSTRNFCCNTMGRGCPDQPYDCVAGEANWVRGWSGDKKNWCCNHHNRGCYDCEEAAENWILDWSPSKKDWCCKEKDVHCYDCEAGKDNWRVGWSVGKKEWCCKQTGMSCFDCDIGYSNWDLGWSEDKKQWCCKHENTGCGGDSIDDGSYWSTTTTTEETTTTSTTSTTSTSSTTTTQTASATTTTTTAGVPDNTTTPNADDMAQQLADAEAEEACNTSIFRVGFSLDGFLCAGNVSGNTSVDDVPSAAACAGRAFHEGCEYFMYVKDDKKCYFKNSSFDGSNYTIGDNRTSGPSDCQKVYINETLEGDFADLVTNKTKFLEECSAAIAPASCVDVVPGSIILTIGGSSKNIVTKAVSGISNDGLKLPSFGTLNEAKDDDKHHSHHHHHHRRRKHGHHHDDDKNATKGENTTGENTTNTTANGTDANATNATNATEDSYPVSDDDEEDDADEEEEMDA